MGRSPRFCLGSEDGAPCAGGQGGGPKQLAHLCKFGGPGRCGEQRCAEHCWCARNNLRTGAARGRSRNAGGAAASQTMPVVPEARPQAASAASGPSARSRSPQAARSSLRMSPAALEERMRSQHRFFASRQTWPLEPTWGYDPGEAATWGQAVDHPVTSGWLASLDAGHVRSVKLQIFLRWARQQRQQPQPQPQPEPRRGPGISAATASPGRSTSPVALPPCCVCLEALPVWACTPCMHLCVCGPCSLLLLQEPSPRCPICRAELVDFARVFY
jgi:hypothetical protein